jgi:predicted metal-dependent HD superfamily phosphohydrolase
METIHTQEVSSLEKRNAAFEMVNFALAKVEQKYGTGVGDGENPKFYHNLEHTKNVLESARKIAELAIKNGNIKVGDEVLVEMAAAGHDLVHGLSEGESERQSSHGIQEEMVKSKAFTVTESEEVNQIILATIVSFENGVMKQSATEDYLTKIMADADLSSIGQPTEYYWRVSQSYFHEIKGTESPSLEDQLAWARGQIAFISNHEFYTEEAKQLFPHKEENIMFAKEQVRRLEEEIDQ